MFHFMPKSYAATRERPLAAAVRPAPANSSVAARLQVERRVARHALHEVGAFHLGMARALCDQLVRVEPAGGDDAAHDARRSQQRA